MLLGSCHLKVTFISAGSKTCKIIEITKKRTKQKNLFLQWFDDVEADSVSEMKSGTGRRHRTALLLSVLPRQSKEQNVDMWTARDDNDVQSLNRTIFILLNIYCSLTVNIRDLSNHPIFFF